MDAIVCVCILDSGDEQRAVKAGSLARHYVSVQAIATKAPVVLAQEYGVVTVAPEQRCDLIEPKRAVIGPLRMNVDSGLNGSHDCPLRNV